MSGIAFMISRRPGLRRLSSKPEILVLPANGKRAVVRQAQPGMMLPNLTVTVVFAHVQYTSWTMATERGAGGNAWIRIIATNY